MSTTLPGGHVIGLGETRRPDNWWVLPLITIAYLGAALAYGTWAAFQGTHYYAGPYLTPLYSPVLFTDPAAIGGMALDNSHVWFGVWPASVWPSFIPMSPALLILPLPGLLRGTCYYYRKAYYRSAFMAPPGCAVQGVRRGKYQGETTLFVFQNLHRYALYLALVYNVILFYDAFSGFFYNGSFGVGVGSIVLLINASLLAGYSFGCHSFRHLFGGRVDCFSCDGVAEKGWKFSTWFNERHMAIAWISLGFVMFTDVYVRGVSSGWWADLNTWGENFAAVAG